jgi:hypothetical protein
MPRAIDPLVLLHNGALWPGRAYLQGGNRVLAAPAPVSAGGQRATAVPTASASSNGRHRATMLRAARLWLT